MQTMTFSDDKLEERFDRYDERFDRIDERLVEVNQRIAETSKETDRRLKEVDRRITEHKEQMSHRFDRVEGDIRDLKKSVDGSIRDLKKDEIGDLKKSVESLQRGLGSVQESVAAVHTTLTRLSFGFALTVVGAILTKSF
jgi:chromosome segregation ATPase